MTIYVVYEKNQYSCDPEKDKALFHCSTKAKALKMIKHYLNEKVKNGDFMGAPRFKELDWQYDEKILFDENSLTDYIEVYYYKKLRLEIFLCYILLNELS